jgi:hypothetical protein
VEEREGRAGALRELDRSSNKHEFNLGWVKREKVRRHPVGNVREERTVVVMCAFWPTLAYLVQPLSPCSTC